MDAQAVCAADDKELQELGISTRGDILALRVFCKRKSEPNKEQARVESEEKKKQLLAFLKSGESSGEGPSRKVSRKLQDKKVPASNKKKRLELGWLHQTMDSGHYVSVRAKDGGGTRIVEMPGDSKKGDIISYRKKLFFPNGLSPLASSDDLLFQLGNYKQEHVEATVCFPDGTVHPFTLSNYSKSNKLSKARLYIMTKKIEESDSDSEVNIVTFTFTTANV